MNNVKRRKIIHIYTHWTHKCGFCGRELPWATDGRNLFCSGCGH